MLAERLSGLVLFILCLPVIAEGVVLYALVAGDPILIREDFVTRNGSTVSVWRFRTQDHGRPIFGVPFFESISDFLRRFRINDMPMFWNVVRGDIGLSECWRHLRH